MMWMILQLMKRKTGVITTGKTTTVRDFVKWLLQKPQESCFEGEGVRKRNN
jgi:GDP-D-mannose dehydratase